MATNPRFKGVTLSRAEIAWIALNTGFGQIRSGGNPLPAPGGIPVPSAGGDLWHQATVATAIAHRESGGVTNAFNPESNNPDGGNDRGLFQINDKFHPEVSDEQAYNPWSAAEAAYRISSAGINWSQWATFDRLTASDLRLADAARRAPRDPTAHLKRTGVVIVNAKSQVPDPIDKAIGNVTGALGGLVEWASYLGAAFRWLADGGWRQLGIGALGVGLVLFAFAWSNRSSVAGAAARKVLPI